MRLVTVRRPGGTSAAVDSGTGSVRLLPFANVGELLSSGPDWRQRTAAGAQEELIDGADYVNPLPHPNKVVCVGLNYADHVDEVKRIRPDYPTLFAKFSATLTGPAADIELPRVSAQADWEAEIGVVIDRPGRNIAPERVADHIAGITAVNDVSIRDWQSRTTQWLQGKCFEATTPVGPAVVTLDELPGLDGIALECRVNGEVVQSSHSGLMLFPISELVSYISTVVTLEAGDLILTGTPGGVGKARTPARFLQPGDVLETTVAGVGTCRNVCR